MSSAMAGQPQGSPGELDQPRSQAPKQRENTPEAPSQTPKDEKDEVAKKDEKPDGEPQQGDEPKGDEKNPLTGQNTAGKAPEHEQGPPVPATLDAERWGELPARIRATFRRQGKDDLPVQYREWIDAYYRRLSQRR